MWLVHSLGTKSYGEVCDTARLCFPHELDELLHMHTPTQLLAKLGVVALDGATEGYMSNVQVLLQIRSIEQSVACVVTTPGASSCWTSLRSTNTSCPPE